MDKNIKAFGHRRMFVFTSISSDVSFLTCVTVYVPLAKRATIYLLLFKKKKTSFHRYQIPSSGKVHRFLSFILFFLFYYSTPETFFFISWRRGDDLKSKAEERLEFSQEVFFIFFSFLNGPLFTPLDRFIDSFKRFFFSFLLLIFWKMRILSSGGECECLNREK